MKKMVSVLLALCLMFALVSVSAEGNNPIGIKVLILPKFEVGSLSGDFPGEGQYYYEAYCAGGEEYDIAGGMEGSKLYVNNGVALYVTGMGKVNAALSVTAVLNDGRFDFSDCYVISTGCAGSSYGTTVMGDVFVITSAIDFDLGHHADAREIADSEGTTWFHDASYDTASVVYLNTELTDTIYEMVKDVPLETTDRTRAFMAYAFDNADWATREPMVRKGTTVSGDNYWKGMNDRNNALLMTETYNCPDAYALTEMEDVAIGVALERLGMADRYIIIRDSVNMDVFMNGASPESLWDENYAEDSLSSGDSIETADIFATAMKNNYAVGSIVVNAILDGTIG